MTSDFKRVRKLHFNANVREVVDIINQLVDGAIQKSGPSNHGVKSITSSDSPYTVTEIDELIRVDTTSGNVTINLPAIATSDGRELNIKRVSGGNNIVTIDANSTETIDGNTTLVIYAKYMGYTLRADAASEWNIIGVHSG
jgi:hypothetical protein